MPEKKQVEIFTDGACSGNPGPGGYGVILRYKGINKELSGGAACTTNNRMELTAVITGLSALKESPKSPVLDSSISLTPFKKDGQKNGGKRLDAQQKRPCPQSRPLGKAATFAGTARGQLCLGQGARRTSRKRTLRPACRRTIPAI